MHTRTHTITKWVLTIQVAACIIGLLNSCSAENNIKKGDAFYAIGEYYNAAAEYKKGYARTSTKEKTKRGERAWKMAECYRKMNYSAKAMGAYQNAVRYKYADDMALLYLAQMQQRQGDYKNAIKNYEAFLEIDPTNQLAINGKKGCELAPTWKENPTLYTVKKEPNLNSRRADYSPVLLGEESDQLFLSSTRTQATGDEISGITGTKGADIFFTKKDDKGKWVPVEGVEGELNSEYDEGAICFSPDGKTMYLTRCSYDSDYPRYAEIYTSQRSDASWSKPSLLTISKDTLSSYAHPAVSPDGHWLYFVSDMPGGLGGLDIWRIALTDGTLGGVENVGAPINSEGDEMFPTFRPNGDLYFSSNGHPGMGGLDLFCAKLDSTKKEETWYITNLKYPMNSSGDDFGMTFEGMYNRGYFCTSRGDARGWDHIMSFECPEITYTVTGWVYEKDGYELPEGLVYMVGDDGTYLKLPLKSDGSFTQDVKPGVSYVFLGTCKGYLNHKEELDVDTSSVSQEYTLQFALPTISAPVLVRNVLYEFDRAELTESSTLALDSLVDLLNENPNVTIELSSHCDYRGNDEYNEKLSQRRAESVVNYLIEHGIAADRLSPVGYGEKQPKTITRKLAEKYDYLNEGDVLTEQFITALPEEEQQEMCDSLNRRTEFRVLKITYGLFNKSDHIPSEMRKEIELENPSQEPVTRIPRNAAGNLIQANDVPLAPEIMAAKEAARKAEEAAAAAKKKKPQTKKEAEKAERTRKIIEEARKDAEAAAKAEAEKAAGKAPATDANASKEKDATAKADAKADNKPKDAKETTKTDAKTAEAKEKAKTDAKTAEAKENTKPTAAKDDTKNDAKNDVKGDAKNDVKNEAKTDAKSDAKSSDAKPGDKTAEAGKKDQKKDQKTEDKKQNGGSKDVTGKEATETTTAAEDAKAAEAAAKAKEAAKKTEEKTPADEQGTKASQKSKKVKKTKAEKKAEKEAKKKAEAEAKAAKKAEAEAKKKAEDEAKAAMKAETEAKKKAEAEAKNAKKASKSKGTDAQTPAEESLPEEKKDAPTETQQPEAQPQTTPDTKENVESDEKTAAPEKTEQLTKAEKKAKETAAKEAQKAEEAKAKALKAEEAKQAKAAKEAEKLAKKEEAQKAKEAKKAAEEEAKKIEAKKSKADKKMEKIAQKEEAQKEKILEKMRKEQEKNAAKEKKEAAQESAETKADEKEEATEAKNEEAKTDAPTQVEAQPETKKETSPEVETAKETEETSSDAPKNETKEERIKRIMEAAKKDVEATKAAEEAKEGTTPVTSESPKDPKAAQKAEKARKAAEAKAAKEAKKAEKAERAAAAKKARLEKRAKANRKSSDSEPEDDNE